MGQNPSFLLKSDCHNLIEISIEVVIGGVENKSEIITILNKYKDTLNNLSDSLDTESLD